MRSRVNSCMFFWALAQGSMVQRPSCSTSSSVTSLFAVFFLNAHWNHCTATRTVKVLTLHLRQGCTTCGLRWKCMRLWPRNSKCKLWGPCICKNSLSALWGYSVERRPNRRVEAEPKQCKKNKNRSCTQWRPYLIKINAMRSTVATRLSFRITRILDVVLWFRM